MSMPTAIGPNLNRNEYLGALLEKLDAVHVIDIAAIGKVILERCFVFLAVDIGFGCSKVSGFVCDNAIRKVFYSAYAALTRLH
jgi:phosphotransferase system  glucose/maltose/N-acetylglucosamine-specific IIC component